MPQANRKNSTTASNLDKLDAKRLIAAHRKASERLKAADIEYKKIPWPDSAHVAVPELGPSFSAYSLETLDQSAQLHIRNYGLDGMEKIEFLRRIEEYKTVFQLLERLHEGWRKQNHADAIEAEQSRAYDEEDNAWKALLKRARSHPREAHVIVKYVTSKENVVQAYRYVEMLTAIAGPARKAARP